MWCKQWCLCQAITEFYRKYYSNHVCWPWSRKEKYIIMRIILEVLKKETYTYSVYSVLIITPISHTHTPVGKIRIKNVPNDRAYISTSHHFSHACISRYILLCVVCYVCARRYLAPEHTQRHTQTHTQLAREHICDLRKNYLSFLFVSWVHVWAVSVDFALVDSFPIPVPKNWVVVTTDNATPECKGPENWGALEKNFVYPGFGKCTEKPIQPILTNARVFFPIIDPSRLMCCGLSKVCQSWRRGRQHAPAWRRGRHHSKRRCTKHFCPSLRVYKILCVFVLQVRVCFR